LLGKAIDRQAEERVRNLPSFGRVDCLGHVPYETMYEYLNSAAIGMVCNQPRHGYDLAQPNKLFEYMSAGLPVIASHFEIWKEVVEGNQCGLNVDPTDPQGIAEAIDYLLERPKLRAEMGENASRAVQEKYNWQRESRTLRELYRKVLNQC
jgi:glycosyltransferase involved in cell wall biosynthesis